MTTQIMTFLTAIWLWPVAVGASTNSDLDAIRDTIQSYIDTTGYSEVDNIPDPFHAEATLFLTGRDGFARYTPKQYADFFANREPGKANGRLGKILSIEVIEDIAWAKASIAIPSRDSLYIDLFLLKKIGDAWQIVSKTATKVSEE